MTKYHHTREDYTLAAEKSHNMSDMCRNLGIRPVGSNYKTLRSKISEYSIDTSHFKYRVPVNRSGTKSPVTSVAIKKKLVRERGVACERCGLSEWMGAPITIELEHIDGDTNNNDTANLLLLCPNCHSLTPTWRRAKSSFEVKDPKVFFCSCGNAKGRSSHRCMECYMARRNGNDPTDTSVSVVCGCGKSKHRKSMQCFECHNASRLGKISWPEDAELLRMLSESNFYAVGRKLGVSDNAVRKRIASKGLTLGDK